jgi:hypothetical protein
MPLLGSYGGSSEYAYRGTIDDFPNDFSFTNQTDAIPGNLLTSNQVTITGINNRALVRVSTGASVSVNGGSYVIPTEASPVFIFNNQTLSVRIPSTSGQLTDFSKSYSANVSVGKKTALWEVRTKVVDVDPTPFTFTNQTNREIGVGYTSNEITVSGLESGFSFPADITSGSGQIIKNGGTGVPSVSVVNGDRIYLRLISPFEYSNFPTGSGTKTNSTTVRVGSYSTSWSVSSRDVDLFIDPFDFNDINNALVSSVYEAFSVNTSGIVTTITGADQGIPLVTAVTGCELRVEQPAAGGGFSIRRPFSTANAIVFNGDRLTARITTSGNFSETKVGIVTVSSFAGRFIVTTRPRPIDTIPDPFTFTDIPSQTRGSTVDSNEITLVGMSTFTDEGVASLTTGTNGGNAQFQVTRGTQVLRNYTGIGTYPVRNGDKIKLRITASSEPNITRTATFRVDGIDTNLVITGTTGFRDDVWSVTSAVRSCDITEFTLPTVSNAPRSTAQTTTFTVGGFQSDCGMVVSTNLGSLSVDGGQTFGNNLSVSPGTVVTLRVTSSASFGASTVATVTVSNSSTGVLPNKTYSATWTINTVQDTTPASVTISASPTSITIGQSTRLTWSSVNATEVVTSSGQGFSLTSTQLSGSNVPVTPTSLGNQTYSITVRSNPSASNAATSPTVSKSVTVSVTEDTTPDSFSLSPSSFTSQNKGAEVSATAQSSTNSSVSVSGLTANTTVSASISGQASGFTVNNGGRVTTANVKNGDVIRVFITNSSNQDTLVSGTLNIGTQSSSFTSRTTACSVPTNQKFYANNAVTVNFKAATVQPNSQSLNLYTSKIGGGTQARAGVTGAKAYTTTSIPSIPNGVTSIQVALVGGGGAGGNAKGGGAGGTVQATVPVSGGQSVTVEVAASGGPGNGASSRILVGGSEAVRALGGQSGNIGGAGGGGTITLGSGTVTPGGSSSGKTGGTTSPTGGTAGQPASGSNGGGGTGGGVIFTENPNGGINLTANNGQNNSNGNTGLGLQGSNGGGSGGSGFSNFPGLPPNTFATNSSSGRGGAAVFYQSSPSSAITWDNVIDTIVTAFNTYKRRPPSDTEMDTYTARFTGTTSVTLSSLDGEIRDSIIPVATSFTDSCGGTF